MPKPTASRCVCPAGIWSGCGSWRGNGALMSRRWGARRSAPTSTGWIPARSRSAWGKSFKTVIREQADRVIERHEQTMRALIAALNEHLGGKP